MEKVNVEQFICSLIRNPKMPDEQTQALVEALHEQGLWYNDDTKEIEVHGHLFHKGQWLICDSKTSKGNPFRIEDVTSLDYILEDQYGNKSYQDKSLAIDDLDNNKYVRQWTMQDAYAGQILRYPADGEPDGVFMFRQFNGQFIETVCGWFVPQNDLCLEISPNWTDATDDDICPAEWKLVETFKKKIADAGYEYNPETNALVRKETT